MQKILSVLAALISMQLQAQPVLYGVAKVPGANKIIYLSKIVPATGDVNVFTGPLASNHIGLSGGNVFDFDRDYYYYLSPGPFLTRADANTGASQNLPVNLSGCSPNSAQYTCQDSSIYAFQFCSGWTSFDFGKYDPDSGVFNSLPISLSTFPGDDYTYDKINHRYLFTSNTTLYSIDLNTMTSSTINLPIQAGSRFRFPQYNCRDTTIYGCYIMQGSTASYLASYNLNTGVFTQLSTSAFVGGGILGGGTALNVVSGLYYYNVGSSIISVRISDGSVAANNAYSFSIPGPTNVFYIQIDQTCSCPNSISLDAGEDDLTKVKILNPFNNEIRISGITSPANFKLFDLTSRLIIERKFQNVLTINTADLQKGIYLYSFEMSGRSMTGKLVKQ